MSPALLLCWRSVDTSRNWGSEATLNSWKLKLSHQSLHSKSKLNLLLFASNVVSIIANHRILQARVLRMKCLHDYLNTKAQSSNPWTTSHISRFPKPSFCVGSFREMVVRCLQELRNIGFARAGAKDAMRPQSVLDGWGIEDCRELLWSNIFQNEMFATSPVLHPAITPSVAHFISEEFHENIPSWGKITVVQN